VSTWADVEVGDEVKGRDGNAWAVEKIANKNKGLLRAATIIRGDKSFDVEMPTGRDVEILSKGAPQIKGVEPTDLAAAVVTSTIGGEVIKVDDGTRLPPRSPRTFQHVGSLLGHLYVEHGIRDLPTASKAAHVHAEHHEAVLRREALQGYRDHTHDLGE
jgi:hypothetical protein